VLTVQYSGLVIFLSQEVATTPGENPMRRDLLLASMAMYVCAGASRAEIPTVCSVLPVEASVRKIGVEHRLLITVENTASTQIELEEFYFGANMLHLRAVTKPDAQDLRRSLALGAARHH